MTTNNPLFRNADPHNAAVFIPSGQNRTPIATAAPAIVTPAPLVRPLAIQIPALPQGGRHLESMTDDQLKRRSAFLSPALYPILPRHEFPSYVFKFHQDKNSGVHRPKHYIPPSTTYLQCNYDEYDPAKDFDPATRLSCSIPEILAHLKTKLNLDSVMETPWLVGSGATHVLKGGFYNDADIIFYLKQINVKKLSKIITDFIADKLAEILPKYSRKWLEEYAQHNYLFKNFTSENYCSFSFGKIDIKFCSDPSRRLCVAPSGGFHIPLDSTKNYACSVTLHAWANTDEFKSALDNYQHRIVVIREIKDLKDPLWKIAHSLNKGSKILGQGNETLGALADQTLRILMKEFPINLKWHDPLVRHEMNPKNECLRFKKKFSRTQENSFSNDFLDRQTYFLNLLRFLHESTSPDCAEALNRFTVLLAEGWLFNTKETINSPLSSFAKLISADPSQTKKLLSMIQGIYMISWIDRPDQHAAYSFPFIENPQSPRLCMSMPNSHRELYLSLSGPPQQAAQEFINAWIDLEKKYSSRPSENRLFLDLAKGLSGNSPQLTKNLRYKSAQKILSSFQKEPIASVVSKQYNVAPHTSEEAFRKFLHDKMPEMFDDGKLQEQLDHIELCQQAFLSPPGDALHTLRECINPIFTNFNARMPPSESSLNTLSNGITKIFESQKIEKITTNAKIAKTVKSTIKKAIEQAATGHNSLQVIFAASDLLQVALKAGLIEKDVSTVFYRKILTSLISTLENNPHILAEIASNKIDYYNKLIQFLNTCVIRSDEINPLIGQLLSNITDATILYAKRLVEPSNQTPLPNHSALLENCMNLLFYKYPQHVLFDISPAINDIKQIIFQYAKNSINNDNASLKAIQFIKLLMDNQHALEYFEGNEIYNTCENLLKDANTNVNGTFISHEKYSTALNTLVEFANEYNMPDLQNKTQHRILWHMLASLISGNDIQNKKSGYELFAKGLHQLTCISFTPEIEAKMKSLRALEITPETISKVMTEIFSLAKLLNIDLTSVIAIPQVQLLMTPEDFIAAKSLTNSLEAAQLFFSYGDKVYQALQVQNVFNTQSLSEELSKLIVTDRNTSQLIQRIQSLKIDQKENNSKAIAELNNTLSHCDKNSLKDFSPELKEYFNLVISNAISFCSTSPLSSENDILLIQSIFKQAFRLGLIQGKAAELCIEKFLPLSVEKYAVESVHAFNKTHSFIQELLEENPLFAPFLRQQLQFLSSRGISAANKVLYQLNEATNAEDAALCIHLALKLNNPKQHQAIANACCVFINHAEQTKDGYLSRLAFEMTYTALKKGISFNDYQKNLIKDFIFSLLDITPQNSERGIPPFFYARLGCDLLIQFSTLPLQEDFTKETRDRFFDDLGTLLTHENPTEATRKKCIACVETIRALKPINAQEVAEWQLLTDATEDDYKNSLSSILRNYINVYFKENREGALNFITKQPLKQLLNEDDFAQVKLLSTDIAIQNTVLDAIKLANSLLKTSISLPANTNCFVLEQNSKLTAGDLEEPTTFLMTVLQLTNQSLLEHHAGAQPAKLKFLTDAIFYQPENYAIINKDVMDALIKAYLEIFSHTFKKTKPTVELLSSTLKQLNVALGNNNSRKLEISKCIEIVLEACSPELIGSNVDFLIELYELIKGDLSNPGLNSDQSIIPDKFSFVSKMTIGKTQASIYDQAFKISQTSLKELSETQDDSQINSLIPIMVLASVSPESNAILVDTICKYVEYALAEKDCTFLRIACGHVSHLPFFVQLSEQQKITILNLAQALLTEPKNFERGKSRTYYFDLGLSLFDTLKKHCPTDSLLDDTLCVQIFKNIIQSLISDYSDSRKNYMLEGYVKALSLLTIQIPEMPSLLQAYAKVDFKKDSSKILLQFSAILNSLDRTAAIAMITNPVLKKLLIDEDYITLMITTSFTCLTETSRSLQYFEIWKNLKVLEAFSDSKWLTNPFSIHSRLNYSLLTLKLLSSESKPDINKISFVINYIIGFFPLLKKSNTELLIITKPMFLEFINIFVVDIHKDPGLIKIATKFCNESKEFGLLDPLLAPSVMQCISIFAPQITLELMQKFVSATLTPLQIDNPQAVNIVNQTIDNIKKCLEINDNALYEAGLIALQILINKISQEDLMRFEQFHIILNLFVTHSPKKEQHETNLNLKMRFLNIIAATVDLSKFPKDMERQFFHNLSASNIIFNDEGWKLLGCFPISLSLNEFWHIIFTTLASSKNIKTYEFFKNNLMTENNFISEKMMPDALDRIICVKNFTQFIANLIEAHPTQRQDFLLYLGQKAVPVVQYFKEEHTIECTKIVNMTVGLFLKDNSSGWLLSVLRYLDEVPVKYLNDETLQLLFNFITTAPENIYFIDEQNTSMNNFLIKILVKYLNDPKKNLDAKYFINIITKLQNSKAHFVKTKISSVLFNAFLVLLKRETSQQQAKNSFDAQMLLEASFTKQFHIHCQENLPALMDFCKQTIGCLGLEKCWTLFLPILEHLRTKEIIVNIADEHMDYSTQIKNIENSTNLLIHYYHLTQPVELRKQLRKTFEFFQTKTCVTPKNYKNTFNNAITRGLFPEGQTPECKTILLQRIRSEIDIIQSFCADKSFFDAKDIFERLGNIEKAIDWDDASFRSAFFEMAVVMHNLFFQIYLSDPKSVHYAQFIEFIFHVISTRMTEKNSKDMILFISKLVNQINAYTPALMAFVQCIIDLIRENQLSENVSEYCLKRVTSSQIRPLEERWNSLVNHALTEFKSIPFKTLYETMLRLNQDKTRQALYSNAASQDVLESLHETLLKFVKTAVEAPYSKQEVALVTKPDFLKLFDESTANIDQEYPLIKMLIDLQSFLEFSPYKENITKRLQALVKTISPKLSEVWCSIPKKPSLLLNRKFQNKIKAIQSEQDAKSNDSKSKATASTAAKRVESKTAAAVATATAAALKSKPKKPKK